MNKFEKSLHAERENFEFFKAKAKVVFQTETEEVSANLQIRMKDNEIIWMSLTKYGKEAARLKMQPDTVFFINKYPNEDRFYSIFLTEEYLKKTGVNLKFSAFQDLFFGKHPLKIEKKDSVAIQDSLIFLVQKRKEVRIETLLNLEDSKLMNTKIISPNQLDTLNISYSGYQWVGEHHIPTLFQINSSQWQDSLRVKNKASVELSSSEFVTEELGFNFTIPEDYEKR